MTTADELSRLFDAERSVRPPEDGVERGVSRLLTDVAQRMAPLPIATGSLRLGLSLVTKWLILGFVVGLAGAGTASQIWSPNAAAAPEARARDLPVVAKTTDEGAPVLVPQPPLPAVTNEPQPAAARVAPAVSLVASAAVAPTFDEELRLIGHAKRELELGRPKPAAAWLAEHEQRFPQGVFALEREALQILLACSRQRQPALAQGFAVRHPSSPMVERLLRACGKVEAGPRSAGDFSEIDK